MKEIFNPAYLGLFPFGKSPSGKGMGINMKIIHVAQKTKKEHYQTTQEIYREILTDITNHEGILEVLQIYTYPEEAFIKQGTTFFTEQEVENLCRDLQALLVKNNVNVVLAFGILRQETIKGKTFLINSAVIISRPAWKVFDKQIVSSVDTLWRMVRTNQKLNFIGDYIKDYIDRNRPGRQIRYDHSFISDTRGYSVTHTDETLLWCPPDMTVSNLMKKTTGTAVGDVWNNYLLLDTNGVRICIWVGICIEICSGNFKQRYESLRRTVRFDREIMILLTNDLILQHNLDMIPCIPFLFHDKHNRYHMTGIWEETTHPAEGGGFDRKIQLYEDDIIL